MKKQFRNMTAGVLILASFWFLPSCLMADVTTDSSADLVLGQADYTHNGVNGLSDKGMFLCLLNKNSDNVSSQGNVTVDTSTGRVYVCDTQNNRILWWNNAGSLLNGSGALSADGVIGQPDFLSWSSTCSSRGLNIPNAVSVDPSGDIWVADTGNNRVLKFTKPTSNGQAATVVLGQPNFTSHESGITSEYSLKYPLGVTVDGGGHVAVADMGNNRILLYATPVNASSATYVFGQPDFNGGGPGTSSTTLRSPIGVYFDNSHHFWVADSGNNRVLAYSFQGVGPYNGMGAAIVLGQSVFTSSGAFCSPAGMQSPWGVSVDTAGNVAVADTGDNRVLIFYAASAVVSGHAADLVLGQTSMYSGYKACSQAGMSIPTGICFDASNNLWIADADNNRILEYTSPSQASLVLGQADFNHGSINITKGSGLFFPVSNAVDMAIGRIYVIDQANSRVLWWNNAGSLTNGKSPDGVIGQPDFYSSVATCTKSGLNFPSGVNVDSSGNVLVTDSGNNRVLRFARPSGNKPEANLVIGQSDFGLNVASCSQRGLGANGTGPLLSAVDSSGNLWVTDQGNSRVLKYSAHDMNSFSPGTAVPASLVLGQSGYSTNDPTCSPTGLTYPAGVFVDISSNVWITDMYNNRVLKYVNPTTSGAAASLVLGKSVFTSTAAACSRTGLTQPTGITLDSSGNVWVADMLNSRVLKYSTPIASGMQASFVIGQPDYTHGSSAITQSGLAQPGGICLDAAGNLWVIDIYNSRVLEYYTSQQTHINHTVNTTITFQTVYGPVTLTIPANTFSSDVTITIKITQVPASTDPSIKLSTIGIEITNDAGLQPGKDMSLTLSYRSQDIADLVDTKLALAYYDTSRSKWKLIPSTVDTKKKIVTGIVRHLSKFAIVQAVASPDLNSVKVFPNPFNPRMATGGMTIANLTATADIKIFNVAGELLRKVPYSSANGQAIWDGKNDYGNLVASGVYIMYIKAPEDQKRIKIAVEK